MLFAAGCADNQARFPAEAGYIVLLKAPPGTLLERLAGRTGNSCGKAPEELGRVRGDLDTVEPVLRRAADHEIRQRSR